MAETKQRLIAALAAWQADPIIADPWADLENVERFGTMQEIAIGTNYKGKRDFVWDYLKPSIRWNFLDWKRERHPPVPPDE